MTIPENEGRTTEMSDTNPDTTGEQLTVEHWLQIRKDEGLRIDPETAEVDWCYAQTLDTYGVQDLPQECRQSGRQYFACAPGSDIWVCFYGLPAETREKLWAMHWKKLAFPAGFEAMRRFGERT